MLRKAIIMMGIAMSCCEPARQGVDRNLPTMHLLLYGSEELWNTIAIPKGLPVILFYFSPDCPHCRGQMQDMLNDQDLMNSFRIYAITSRPMRDIHSFYDELQLSKYPSVQVGVDVESVCSHYYNIKGVPFTAVYDAEMQLVVAYSGRVNVDQLQAHLTK